MFSFQATNIAALGIGTEFNWVSVQCTRMHYAAAVGMRVDIVNFRVVAYKLSVTCRKVRGTFIKLVLSVPCVHGRHQNERTVL